MIRHKGASSSSKVVRTSSIV